MDFTPTGNQIRFGLSAIKNLGETASKEIVRARSSLGRFSSLSDFCNSVDMRLLKKSAMESIIKAGALDSVGLKRAQMMAALPDILQRTLLGRPSGSQTRTSNHGSTQFPDMAEWSLAERLAGEKDVLGLYVTGHPLDEYKTRLAGIKTHKTSSLQEMGDKAPVTLAGLLTEFTEARSKKGKPYAKAVLEDFCGPVGLVVFESPLQQFRSLLDPGRVLVIKGRVHCEVGARPEVYVDKVEELQAGLSNDPQIQQIRGRTLSPSNPKEETPATEQDFCLKK